MSGKQKVLKTELTHTQSRQPVRHINYPAYARIIVLDWMPDFFIYNQAYYLPLQERLWKKKLLNFIQRWQFVFANEANKTSPHQPAEFTRRPDLVWNILHRAGGRIGKHRAFTQETEFMYYLNPTTYFNLNHTVWLNLTKFSLGTQI